MLTGSGKEKSAEKIGLGKYFRVDERVIKRGQENRDGRVSVFMETREFPESTAY